jgi:succinate dehydrogenase/fumarate reductase cytochrome b subunit
MSSASGLLSFKISELFTPNSELGALTMFPYYFIRFSGPLLLILVGLKILSGYSLTGKITGVSWLTGLHENRTLDFFLLLFVTFHALYGLRLFLIDLGWVKKEKILFWSATLVGLGLLALSYLYLF